MKLRFMHALLALILAHDAIAYTPLSDETLKSLPRPGDDFDIKSGTILSPILIPRVPGTPGSEAVQKHFVDYFTTHLPNWRIEFQNSTSKTPATGDKDVPFRNIIITRDPPWAQPGDVGRLALVAHYDSKLTPAGFIGAIDSAAPCAMIIHAVKTVDDALMKKWAEMEKEGTNGLEEEKGLQILFLDGEEAFLSWTSTDSLYGSRSLAEEWESTPHTALSTHRTALSSITLFLLLDLLGSANPHVPSYFATTHWAYQYMALIEARLRTLDLAESTPQEPFLDGNRKSFGGRFGIQDDHLPFLDRGVEILHMIPSPFPTEVWHRIEDDGEHLDMPTVEDWAQIFTAFVAEWMDLEGYLPANAKGANVKAKRITSKTEL
ncbi:hypothetical protein B7494_g7640 [Chlorociboria aeruginascens]|nr:hypothetical protein B7494_g7640 [Chlorociboria aeruginascens]